jgi:hypothetical protein
MEERWDHTVLTRPFLPGRSRPIQLISPVICVMVRHDAVVGGEGGDNTESRKVDLPDDADDRGAGVGVRSRSGSIICESRNPRNPALIDGEQNRRTRVGIQIP